MIGSVTSKGAETDGLTPIDPNSGPGLSDEEVFEMLSNRRRRYALHYLIQEGRTDLGNLAERIAAWEYEKSVEDVSSDERKRVYCALQQSHLPKMDSADVVEFDKRRGVIEPTEATEQLDIYLDVVRGDEIPWSEFYVGLSFVAVALVVAISIGAYPFTVLPNVAWTGLLIAAFSISSVCHFVHARKMRLGVDDRPPEA